MSITKYYMKSLAADVPSRLTRACQSQQTQTHTAQTATTPGVINKEAVQSARKYVTLPNMLGVINI